MIYVYVIVFWLATNLGTLGYGFYKGYSYANQSAYIAQLEADKKRLITEKADLELSVEAAQKELDKEVASDASNKTVIDELNARIANEKSNPTIVLSADFMRNVAKIQ